MYTSKAIVQNRTISQSSIPKQRDALVRNLDLTLINNSSTPRAIATPLNYNIDDPETFYVLTGPTPRDYNDVNFSLKEKVESPNYDLYIWVDDNELNDLPSGAIEHLSTKFQNIYPDMVSIFGKPWGTHNFGNLIDNNRDDIHILLTDISNDGNTENESYIYGYYSSFDLNLFTPENNSNACLNLVIDSHIYFNRNTEINNNGWNINNMDTVDAISTLIHEFQHMIHFYQKNILNNINSTSNDGIYVNEMFSMIAEDVLAYDHLKFEYSDVTAFRPPAYARLWYFNESNTWRDKSLLLWDDSLDSYSNAYSLGSYLIRNYDLSFLSTYFKGNNVGVSNIITAIQDVTNNRTYNKTDLLLDYGEAILRSNSKITIKPKILNSSQLITATNSLNSTSFSLDTIDYYNQFVSSFTPYTISEINNKSNKDLTNFYRNSNIYIDLGLISSTDVIEIDFYTDEIDVEYRLVY